MTINTYLTYFIYILIILIRVAFITLLEQKILGSLQIRVGPKYVGYWGLLQSFADALKLLTKERVKTWQINYNIYIICPIISLILSLILWLSFPLIGEALIFKLRVIYFICVRGLATYPIILSGWSSNCKYSILGRLRRVAQLISYEISIGFIILCLVYYYFVISISIFFRKDNFIINIFTFVPIIFIWLICIFAETNRTPYDFSERESELVSGYNTEFRSGGFTLFFIAEYRRIIFIRIIFCYIFLYSAINKRVNPYEGILIIYLFIWSRGSFPRTRYDKLIILAWKNLLPCSLFFLSFYVFYNL